MTEGQSDKLPFIYLYYAKIYAIERGIATMIESDNLLFMSNHIDELEKIFKNHDKKGTMFSKNILFSNTDLEKIYVRLEKKKIESEAELSQLIEEERTTYFSKLTLNKILTPRVFE